MNVDDIYGTKPRVNPQKPEKDLMNIKDIAGSSKNAPYFRKSTFNYIDYNDVTAKLW